jgi:hypothetical protein
MNQITETSPLIELGNLDRKTLEIIEQIKSRFFPGDFFQWLSNGSFTLKLLDERLEAGRYMRMGQFYIQNSLVFTGRIEIDLETLPKDVVQFLTNLKAPLLTSLHSHLGMIKKRVSQTASEQFYTATSQLYHQETLLGFGWEIYELSEILKIYETK